MSEQKNDTSTAARKAALNILLAVLKEGQSLSSSGHLSEKLPPRDAAFARMLSYGVLRYYFQLKSLLKPLMKKKLKAKDQDIELIMQLALYQVLHSRVPDYAVVDAAVEEVRKSKKKWAAGMVNAVLRNFIRQKDELLKQPLDEEAEYNHPAWMIEKVKQDHSLIWQQILSGNNQQPPMTLRINAQKTSAQDYLALLRDEGLDADPVVTVPAALILKQPGDVLKLPGYTDGLFSVQDAGAQFAAQLLRPEAGELILDACAAPGGKTAHLFELQPSITLHALDVSESRLQRVEENCSRLGFSPELIVADAAQADNWWQGQLYDRILLDVPCSASGVIRRHPDIKHLRRAEDIDALVQLQRDILQSCWPLLKPGGQMLYATCSIFSQENQQQIEWFLGEYTDARLLPAPDWLTGYPAKQNLHIDSHGIQLLPVEHFNDGFYYALVEKKKESN